MKVNRQDEMALVMKALEIRSDRQTRDMLHIDQRADSLLIVGAQETQAWSELRGLLGAPDPGRPGSSNIGIPSSMAVEGIPKEEGWEEILRESQQILVEEGIDPTNVKLVIPGALTNSDVAWALAIGALGAALPSIGPNGGFIKSQLDGLEGLADQGKLPGFLEAIFGGKHPGDFMDAGSAGMYHRFMHGHDLFWALPTGISLLGFTKGIAGVFQHLLRDSCGMTGIPLPGSQLFGQKIAEAMGGGGIKDLFSGRDLSRYAGFQMADGVSTASVSFMLWVHEKAKGIDPDSIRSKKIAILAHGMCFSAIAIAAITPGLQTLVPYRSHLNHASLLMMSKNVYQLWRLTQQLDRENQARFIDLERGMDELKLMRFGGAQALDQEWLSISSSMAY